MRILKAGALYFAFVFGTGFILGPIRLSWVVPRFGTRIAELLESPIMLVVMVASARSVVRRLAVPAAVSSRLGMGLVALVLMLIAEFGFVLWLRGMTFVQYLTGRDPVSGTVYYLMLGMMAVLPLLVTRRES